jgi:hypothetical protein
MSSRAPSMKDACFDDQKLEDESTLGIAQIAAALTAERGVPARREWRAAAFTNNSKGVQDMWELCGHRPKKTPDGFRIVRSKRPKEPIAEPAALVGVFVTEADAWKALYAHFMCPRPRSPVAGSRKGEQSCR